MTFDLSRGAEFITSKFSPVVILLPCSSVRRKVDFRLSVIMHMHFFCYTYYYSDTLIFGAVILFDCAIPLNYKAVKLWGFTIIWRFDGTRAERFFNIDIYTFFNKLAPVK